MPKDRAKLVINLQLLIALPLPERRFDINLPALRMSSALKIQQNLILKGYLQVD